MSKIDKPKAIIGKMISVCPGNRHAWFESNYGKIRKPIDNSKLSK